jgi:transcription termination/antitermination protein NusA
MLDLKTMKSALEQLETERKIPREKIIDAIEQALAAAYKKDYGKKGQIIRAKIDIESGKMEFYQVKIVVDESLVRMTKENEEEEEIAEDDDRVRYNEEHHILIADAKKIKNDAKLEEEIIFPLETKEDYGRIAAQTAKQVIIQKIREAERGAVIEEYGSKEGEIINGFISKVERGIVYIDFNRATGIILPEEQIPGEFYKRGDRIRAYLYSVEETPRGVNLKLSRTHPQLIEGLFAMEAPEIASGVVEIKAIAREAGSRSKIAVYSNDEHVDPVGSCVGQKGIRVTTVMSELNGEKIDIIPWSADTAQYVSSSISPARVLDIKIIEGEHKAIVEVANDQLSLAIGKGGQNVRLAAKLTGWRIDIKASNSEEVISSEDENDILDGGIVDDGTDDK